MHFFVRGNTKKGYNLICMLYVLVVRFLLLLLSFIMALNLLFCLYLSDGRRTWTWSQQCNAIDWENTTQKIITTTDSWFSESVVNQNTCCNQVIKQKLQKRRKKYEIYNRPYNCGAQQHVHLVTYALHFYLFTVLFRGLTHIHTLTHTTTKIIILNNSTIDWIIKTNLKWVISTIYIHAALTAES